MEIMVEDDQLSLAIGRKGQNVRLAAQLTGWRLDIISKTKLPKAHRGSDLQPPAHRRRQRDDGSGDLPGRLSQRSPGGGSDDRESAEEFRATTPPKPRKNSKNGAAAVVEKAGDVLAVAPGRTEDEQGQLHRYSRRRLEGRQGAR